MRTATAPLTIGAEKLVPELVLTPVPYRPRMLVPGAAMQKAAVTPQRLLQLAMVPLVSVPTTAIHPPINVGLTKGMAA